MRAQLYDPEMTLNGGCIELDDPVPTPAAEGQLLAAVETLYAQGVLPMCLDPVSVAQGFGAAPGGLASTRPRLPVHAQVLPNAGRAVHQRALSKGDSGQRSYPSIPNPPPASLRTRPEHSDLVLFAVWHHFRRRQRWDAATAFFSRLGACYPAAAVWEAAALRASGHSEGVLELLGSALERSPSSPPLLVAMAAECMRLEQVRRAGRRALVAHRRSRYQRDASGVAAAWSTLGHADRHHIVASVPLRLAVHSSCRCLLPLAS